MSMFRLFRRCLAASFVMLFLFSLAQDAYAYDLEKEKQEEQQVINNYKECMSHASGHPEALACGKEVYDYWDAKLNASYKAMQKACDEHNNAQLCRKQLADMQKAWTSYKDRMTDFLSTLNEKSPLAEVEVQSFLIEATRLQARNLRP